MKLILTTLSLLLFWNTKSTVKHDSNRVSNENSQQVDVELTIKNIRKNTGKIKIGFFKDQASFEKEIPYKGLNEPKEATINGVLTLKTRLEPGIYGAALMDDENSNGKMDYNLIGVPKEGFGFSNYYHTGFFKPKIYPFQFEVKDSKTAKVEIVVRYLL
jgi:uncharacterized protein (DUF2141 family)